MPQYIAWRRVISKTIENCFCCAGLKESFFDEDDEFPLAQWILKYNEAENDEDNSP